MSTVFNQVAATTMLVDLKTEMFEIVDNHTKAVVAVSKGLIRAHNKANKLDLAYGAVRYSVRMIK